jgi:CheY-like chemotaxis protein
MGWLMESIAEPPAAVEFARRLFPDLLCIDLAVAGEQGFELCGRIRGDAMLQHTRILGISDQTTMDALKKAESVGVNAYVRKPLTREKFIKYATALTLHRFNPPFPPASTPEAATAPRLVIQTRSNDEGSRRD